MLVHPIRIQPETLGLTIGGVSNSGAVGAISSPIGARVTGSRRGIGLFARTVTIRLPLTGQPAGYLPGGRITLPVLTESLWESAVRGVECTYLTVACELVGRSAEEAK